MAFKPEPMQRTVIVAPRRHEKTIIETLHALEAAHFNDYAEQREGEMAAFRIGRPLKEAPDVAKALVRVRALLRHLDAEDHTPARRFTVADIERDLATAVVSVEQDITSAAESKHRIQQALDQLADEAERLQPAVGLPLALDDYFGYDSLQVFVGFTTDPFRDELSGVVPDHVLFTGDDGFFALMVPTARAAATTDVLYKHGYREHAMPEGAGDIAQRLTRIETQTKDLGQKLEAAGTKLEQLRAQHADFLVAAEEHLSIQAQKADAPLSFAATENAFVVDAWVPESEVRRTIAALERATHGDVHVEKLPHVTHAMHGMDDVHGGADHDPHADDGKSAPPTKLRHKGANKNFAFFTEMFSVPKYDEIDPTAVLSIAFPLFFGFMIADLGFGVIMALMGFMLYRKLGHIEGLKELGFAIGIAGVIAAIIGGFVFQDAFGMPFGVPHHEVEHFEHENWIEHWSGTGAPILTAAGATEFHSTAGAALTCKDFASHVGEWPWTCTFGGGTKADVTVTHPIWIKSVNISELLLVSLLAAGVHLLIGLLFGIRNEWGHGTKHTVAKFGWLVLLMGFFPVVLALVGDYVAPATETLFYYIGGGGFLIGAVLLGWSEGVTGVLEIPSMFSNILSYLRLGAVVIAKGAMAVAFNQMTLVNMGVLGGGFIIAVGFVLFIVVQMLLFVLGLLSGGIQGIRLNYVEFFTKFYKGGGLKFTPFGHARRFSIASGPTGPSVGGGKL